MKSIIINYLLFLLTILNIQYTYPAAVATVAAAAAAAAAPIAVEEARDPDLKWLTQQMIELARQNIKLISLSQPKHAETHVIPTRDKKRIEEEESVKKDPTNHRYSAFINNICKLISAGKLDKFEEVLKKIINPSTQILENGLLMSGILKGIAILTERTIRTANTNAIENNLIRPMRILLSHSQIKETKKCVDFIYFYFLEELTGIRYSNDLPDRLDKNQRLLYNELIYKLYLLEKDYATYLKNLEKNLQEAMPENVDIRNVPGILQTIIEYGTGKNLLFYQWYKQKEQKEELEESEKYEAIANLFATDN